MRPEPFRLNGIELATAIVYGRSPTIPALDIEPDQPIPRAALETILSRALRRPPCVIGFSGGRDSSALLALAAHVARRDGLPMPIAATNIFPGDTQSAESGWQEMLIAHSQIDSWEKLSFTGELDVIGPVAQPFLRRFGPTFPFNGHFGMPSMALARGGTYVTGVGGDELFEPNEMTRLARLILRQARVRRSDLKLITRAMSPKSVRVRHWRTMLTPEPWLHPEVSDSFSTDVATVIASQHLWFTDQVRDDVWRDRARPALTATLGAFAGTVDVDLVHPFQEASLLRSVAAHAGRGGWSSRAAAMQDLFGDVLPGAVVKRATKAAFDTIFFHDYSRDFIATWDGSGVDESLIDLDKLRAAWSAEAVDARSLSLLQAAWHHKHGDQTTTPRAVASPPSQVP